MNKYEVEKLTVNVTSLLFGGLIAVSLVVLPGFISAGALDIVELFSLSCLGLSLPVLAGGIVVNYVGIQLAPEGKTPGWASVLIWAAMSIDLLGIAAALGHASWIPSILFVAASIISFAMFYPSCRKMLQEAYMRARENQQV